MPLTKAIDEVVDFIASTDAKRVAAFQASESTRDRVADLVARSKVGGLTPDERSELDAALQMEHIMRLAKARARLRLQSQVSGE
jgi:hypothetical protein